MSAAKKISSATVRDDFNDLVAVVHYTRAAHELGLWKSEQILIERYLPRLDAPLLEAGCGAGRVTLGLWSLGYRNITAFDFADELIDQARSLAAERGADTGPHALRFFHADATRLTRSDLMGHTDPDAGPTDQHPTSGDSPGTAPPPTPSCDIPRSAPPKSSCNPIGYTKAGVPPREADSGEGECNRIGYTKAGATPQGGDGGGETSGRVSGTGHETGSGRAAVSGDATGSGRVTGRGRAMGSGRNELFCGALFMFNGLMQIPGRESRRAALRGLHGVCAPGAPLLFTTHDRDSSPTERALWRLEAQRWARGEQDPRLVEFGDRYFEEAGTGRTFMHLPSREEVLADLEATGWDPAFDAMRTEIARESAAVLAFSDECRFWAVHRR